MMDKIPNEDQRDSEHRYGQKAAPEPGPPVSGQPPASGPQITMRCMGAIGMPAHEGTHD
jgi:hypothetical protein